MGFERLNLYWGELHNHNEVGYGKGSMDRAYRLAMQTLDVYAFTPHGWWPDLPDEDPQAKERHLRGFERVREQWDHVVDTANRMNQKAGFTVLVAYEWHSRRWGDYCVYFPGPSGELHYAQNPEELREFCDKRNALMLPHHCAYRLGWRGTDWEKWDGYYSPTAEVFSEHGNSLEADTHFPMTRHSMGGADRRQTISEQLKQGKRLGFTAGTDNHFGYPGSYGEGLTGIYAPELTREAVLEALVSRHVFAVTGDRIQVEFQLGSAIMGDECKVPADGPFRFRVGAPAPLDYVEIVKNGVTAARWKGPKPDRSLPEDGTAQLYVFRLEWGWGGLHSSALTRWHVEVSVAEGNIREAIPCFCGGPDTLEEEDSLECRDANHADIRSTTCRSNANPTDSAILKVEASRATRIHVAIKGEWGDEPFNRTLDMAASDLAGNDALIDVAPVFSAPKMKLHSLCNTDSLELAGEWNDTELSQGNYYYLKVLQTNGHMAWSSPIWYDA